MEEAVTIGEYRGSGTVQSVAFESPDSRVVRLKALPISFWDQIDITRKVLPVQLEILYPQFWRISLTDATEFEGRRDPKPARVHECMDASGQI
jgi:hypothetical protein